MRGVVIGRRNGLITLIRSLFNQLSYFSTSSGPGKPLIQEVNEREGVTWNMMYVYTKEQKKELARMTNKLSKSEAALVTRAYTEYVYLKLQEEEEEEEENGQMQQDSREHKEELARIAKTVPESAPDAAKEYAEYVARLLQITDEDDIWNFEEKIRRMQEVVEMLSQGYK